MLQRNRSAYVLKCIGHLQVHHSSLKSEVYVQYKLSALTEAKKGIGNAGSLEFGK